MVSNYFFQVLLECINEYPKNVTITVQCEENYFFTMYTVEYTTQPVIINGTEAVLQYQQCLLIVVFSNHVGSSEPLVLTLCKLLCLLSFIYTF